MWLTSMQIGSSKVYQTEMRCKLKTRLRVVKYGEISKSQKAVKIVPSILESSKNRSSKIDTHIFYE